MSKVLVDRELLERTATHLEWDGSEPMTTIQFAQKCDGLADELRRAIAQPAEAEGVEAPVVACISSETGELYREDYGLKDPIYLVLQSDHLAALSAVTAERDGLAAARMAYANEFAPDENGDPDVGSVHANILALKAERDRLQSELDALKWEIASPNISYALRDQLLGQLAGDHEPEEIMCVEDFYSWLANAIDNVRAEHRKAEGGQPVRVFASAAMAAKEA